MSEEPLPLACAHSIIDAVPRLARLMRQDLRLHSAGLFTEAQFRVMAHLFREGARCISDLAEHMGVSLPTISKLVQGLGSRGLVARSRDPEDRRRVLLALTPAGVTAYEGLLRRTEDHIVDWIAPLSAAEQRQVIASFTRLVEAFDEVCLPETYDDV
jgi:MarR family transcriptional regulator for hemolysin